MFIVNWFQESVMGETLMILFLVATIGYLVGSITIKGVELGTAGVLLVALVFGHFIGNNEELVDGLGMFQDLGLICFVTSVGFIAGPNFSVTLRLMRNPTFCWALSLLRSEPSLQQGSLRSQVCRQTSRLV